METPQSLSCPRCGSPIPAEAPLGLCPRCVLADAATTTADLAAKVGANPGPSLERVAAAFPQLELVERIGAGGMGVVFKARQPRLDRFVALKLLDENLARDPQFAERFHREARVLARLNHPNIVTVHDFGEAGGFFYLLMEYIDGVNLRDAMRAGRFTPTEALKIVPALCDALHSAHEEGILHRDIKPENILLDARGRVKIADFGIAKILGVGTGDITLTGSRSALGTPQYMAPEQIERPQDVDHRADIYSLGVVFYEMLTGEIPMGRFAPPSQKVDLDARVDDIVLRALARERELRQQSAAEMGTQVESVRQTPLPSSAGAPVSTQVPRGNGGGVGDESRSADKATGASTPDFLLCHPALPAMAQAITVFTLVVAPALFLIGLMTMRFDAYASPYSQFTSILTHWTLQVLGLVSIGVGWVGGWQLRALRPSGPRWVCVSFGISLATGLVALLGTVWTERLEMIWRSRSGVPAVPELPQFSPGEALVGVLSLAALVFEFVALLWLVRRGATLGEVLSSRAQGLSDTPNRIPTTPASPPQSQDVLPQARRAVGWTLGSLAVGTILAAANSLHAFRSMSLEGGLSLPSGVARVVVGLVGAAVVVFGIFGAVQGARGLAKVRLARGSVPGAGRMVMATFGWPLWFLEFGLVLGCGALLWTIAPGGLSVVGAILVALVGGHVATRCLWRWVRGVPLNPSVGGAPHWALAWVAATLVSGLLAATPALTHVLAKQGRFRDESLWIQLRLAEERLAEVRARHANGVVPSVEVTRAERDLARAQAVIDNDPVAVALAELRLAEKVFDETRRQAEAGVVSALTLREAEAELRLRQIDVDKAQRQAGRTGMVPPNRNP